MDGRWRKIVIVLVVLGMALRVRPYVACPSYWYDEAYLLLNVFTKSFVDLLGPLREDQAAPPLFLWLLRGLYRLGGGGEWLMRLPALAASLAGLLVMAPLARRLAGRRGACCAIAFCALGHHAAGHAAEVKPYALDFLTCALILLATLACQTAVGKRRSWVVLTVLAVLAPWLSYPSVFVLGAASASLLLKALRHRRRWAAWAIVTGSFALSGLVLWRTVIRSQATSSLRQFWAASFVDLSSPSAAVAWTARCLVEVGNYATREMGLALVLLAVAGAASLWRRPERLLLVMGPFVFALFAGAMRLYPLGGRLLFFLAPCLWLLAGRGMEVVFVGRIHRFARIDKSVVATLAALVLLAPSLLWAGRFLIAVTPRCQFREAFAYVEARRAPGDVLWVSHPQVYQVYHGGAPDLSAYSPPQTVERAAGMGRLWMVCAVAGSHERYTAAETVQRVQAAPCTMLEYHRFRGLHVMLSVPSSDLSGQWAWRRTAKTSD